jgi:hypothetical protein
VLTADTSGSQLHQPAPASAPASPAVTSAPPADMYGPLPRQASRQGEMEEAWQQQAEVTKAAGPAAGRMRRRSAAKVYGNGLPLSYAGSGAAPVLASRSNSLSLGVGLEPASAQAPGGAPSEEQQQQGGAVEVASPPTSPRPAASSLLAAAGVQGAAGNVTVMSLKHIVVPPPALLEAPAPQPVAPGQQSSLQQGPERQPTSAPAGAAPESADLSEPAASRLGQAGDAQHGAAPARPALAADALVTQEQGWDGPHAGAPGERRPAAAQRSSPARHTQEEGEAPAAAAADGEALRRSGRGSEGAGMPGSGPFIKASRSCCCSTGAWQRGGSGDTSTGSSSSSSNEGPEYEVEQLLPAGGLEAGRQESSGDASSSYSSRRVSRASSAPVQLADMKSRCRPLEIGELLPGAAAGLAGAAGHGLGAAHSGPGVRQHGREQQQGRALPARLALRSHPISIRRADVLE